MIPYADLSPSQRAIHDACGHYAAMASKPAMRGRLENKMVECAKRQKLDIQTRAALWTAVWYMSKGFIRQAEAVLRERKEELGA